MRNVLGSVWMERQGGWMEPTHMAQNISIYTLPSQQFGKHRNRPPSSSVWPLGCGSGSLEGYPAAFPLGIVSTCRATPPFPCNCTGNLVICLDPVPQDRMGLGVLLAAVLHNTAQILHHSGPTSHPKPLSLPAPATSMSASKDCQKGGMLSSDPGPHSQLRGPTSREGPPGGRVEPDCYLGLQIPVATLPHPLLSLP